MSDERRRIIEKLQMRVDWYNRRAAEFRGNAHMADLNASIADALSAMIREIAAMTEEVTNEST